MNVILRKEKRSWRKQDKEGVVVLPSGLQYKIIREGNEVRATATDTVEVHYVGTLIDGTEFDSSYSRNEMAQIPHLTGLSPAWTEGMQLVGEGGKIILYVPSELGYQSQRRRQCHWS